MKHQFNNSFLKRQELAAIVRTIRVRNKETDVCFPIYLTNTLMIKIDIPGVVLNIYLEVLHRLCKDKKPPQTFVLAVGGGDYRGSMFEKMPPQRFDPLVLLLASRRGRLLARSLSKGAALLHQRVYYDRDAPCETVVESPSASNGWSV